MKIQVEDMSSPYFMGKQAVVIVNPEKKREDLLAVRIDFPWNATETENWETVRNAFISMVNKIAETKLEVK